jgi:hypothetical protein
MRIAKVSGRAKLRVAQNSLTSRRLATALLRFSEHSPLAYPLFAGRFGISGVPPVTPIQKSEPKIRLTSAQPE